MTHFSRAVAAAFVLLAASCTPSASAPTVEKPGDGSAVTNAHAPSARVGSDSSAETAPAGRVVGIVQERAESVAGKLSAITVRRYVLMHLAAIRRCYDRGLETIPALEGMVRATFTIDANGEVKDATSDGSDMAEASVTDCIIATLRKITFPKPESAGMTNVVYLFVLRAEREPWDGGGATP